jgi:hypothetical protein
MGRERDGESTSCAAEDLAIVDVTGVPWRTSALGGDESAVRRADDSWPGGGGVGGYPRVEFDLMKCVSEEAR